MTPYEGIEPAEPLPHYVSNPNDDDDYYDSSPNIECSADFRTLPEEWERELRLQREQEEATYLSSLDDPAQAHLIEGITNIPSIHQPSMEGETHQQLSPQPPPLNNPSPLAAVDPAPLSLAAANPPHRHLYLNTP